ncbi:hypothetical protein KI387_033420, partial [Taxus chinensis]
FVSQSDMPTEIPQYGDWEKEPRDRQEPAISSCGHPTEGRFKLGLHWTRVKSNLQCKAKWAEVNGSMGDLGTFIPIVIALTLVNGLDLGTTLIFTGMYNIITGLCFGVPMPVQPMKSIAAVAISEGKNLNIPEIMAAGICTSGILFGLGITGLMKLGLAFAFTAVKYIRKEQDFAKNKAGDARPWLGLDGLLLALVCLGFILLVNGSGGDDDDSSQRTEDIPLVSVPMDGSEDHQVRKSFRNLKFLHAVPSALIVFVLGIVLAIARNSKVLRQLKLGPSKPHLIKISRHEWKTGFVRATIPQIPLSVLNSVIAVCKLSTDLFPKKEVTPNWVSVSVGLMNLVGCWFGAMPVCHGAGGLAGQYKFGARSGASVAFLGTVKLILGIELAMACRDMNSKKDSFVMLMCAAVSLTGSSAALGFGFGVVLYVILKFRDMDFSYCKNIFRPLFIRRNLSYNN